VRKNIFVSYLPYEVGLQELVGLIALWKTIPTGGKEVKIANSHIFVPGKNGIYYVDDGETPFRFHLNFLDFKTQQARIIGLLPGPVGWNIEISPDERSFLYSKYDREGSELMLVDDFH
jgi:hypothetical protein